MEEKNILRAIAFYLPQFHPVPENDEWWGAGFTEWRNVVRARPLLPNHYQPHIPADLGFYDLRLAEVRNAQAALARKYGLHGFCYYHYWFNGRRILQRPFTEVLASGQPDFPFCLCWANENWTRVWDGGEKNVLLGQNYSDQDDIAHIESLIPAFKDKRYIRIAGRPLFLVYRTELLPDPRRTAEIWRERAAKAGVGDLYLVRVESFLQGIDPMTHGCDAAVEFAPDGHDMGKWKFHDGIPRILSKLGIISKAYAANRVVSYPVLARGMMSRPLSNFKRFRCVTPMWDNSARRKKDARIVIDSHPDIYRKWLRHLGAQTLERYNGDERLIFINAWNEWAEGNHLEPDLKWGHAYLEATRTALTEATAVSMRVSEPNESTPPLGGVGASRSADTLRRTYWQLRAKLAAQRELLSQFFWRQP